MNMKAISIASCIVLVLLGCTGAWAQVGIVRTVEGDVRVLSGKLECAPRFGLDLDEGDTLRTGDKSWAMLVMIDGTRITVRPQSELTVTRYRYTDAGEITQNLANLTLTRGAIRVVAGHMGKGRNAGFAVRTRDAEMLLRGADHDIAYVAPEFAAKPKPGDPEQGTYAKVYGGEALLKSAGKEAKVQAGQSAYAGGKDKTAPKVLPSDPYFFHWHSFVDRRVASVIEKLDAEPLQ